jgi:hypothetical protein
MKKVSIEYVPLVDTVIPPRHDNLEVVLECSDDRVDGVHHSDDSLVECIDDRARSGRFVESDLRH